MSTFAVRRLCVLRHVGQRLRDDVVRRGLDVLRQPLVEAPSRPPRSAGVAQDLVSAGPQALLGERRGMQSARELAQFLEREIQLLRRALQRGSGRVRVRLQLSSGEPDRQRQRDEPLLRSVVEVPLELSALLVARLDEAGA